jgi:hypothetical protein
MRQIRTRASKDLAPKNETRDESLDIVAMLYRPKVGCISEAGLIEV